MCDRDLCVTSLNGLNLILCSYRIVKLPHLAFHFDLLLPSYSQWKTIRYVTVPGLSRFAPRAHEISTLQGLLVDLYVPRKCSATSMYLKTDKPVLANVDYLQTVSSHPKITPQFRSVSPMLMQTAGL